MIKNLCLLFLFCGLSACNKEVEQIALPPFSVFPNPFTDVIQIYYDTSRFPNSPTVVRVLNGKEKTLVSIDHGTAAGQLSLQLSEYEAGVYYVEMDIDRETFILPILKTE